MEMIAGRGSLLVARCSGLVAVATLVVSTAHRGAIPQTRVARPNVVFVVVDTTRVDRFFGPRGSARWLARQPGTEFENAWSQAPTTNSAVATLFTGLLPSQHGVFDGGSELPRQAMTLAEHFRGAGYATAHITGNPNSGPPYGLDRGFQHLRWSNQGEGSDLLHEQLQHADAIGALALEFLAGAASPFLLSLHFNDPHSPYDPPAASAPAAGLRRIYDEPSSDASVGGVSSRERQDMLARYDAEIASVDRALAAIVAALERRGIWDRTLLIVTADHGEEFQDHGGWGHSHSLYPELLRVPLFIRAPDDRLRRVERGRVNHADVLPTVLELAGLPPGGRMWGRSRTGLLHGTGAGAESTIAEKLSREKGAPLRAWITDDLSLIERPDDGSVELYDRRRDPAQLRNLASSRPLDVGRLQDELASSLTHAQRPEAAKAAGMEPDTLRHLQSLGYLQGRQATTGAAVSAMREPPSPGLGGSGAAVATRAILGQDAGGRSLWAAVARDRAIVADSSPREFHVEVTLPAVTPAERFVRLRFAAAEHPTTISAMTLRGAGIDGARGGRERQVTFGGRNARRLPAGAVIESDPVASPEGAQWVVAFDTNPLALVRIAGAAQTKLMPGAATIDGTLGLIAIVKGSR